jgi:LPXTG-motif cell wall-anchored protein
VSRKAYPLVFAVCVALVTTITAPTLDATAKAKNRAGVVVRLSDGELRKMCVFFDEPSITGSDLLERAGLDTETDSSPLGTAVCKIGTTGCGSGDCFCRYPVFWGYWTRDGASRSWRFSDVGSSDRKVVDGSLDGWSWGRDGKPAPPKIAFEDACPASAVAASSRPAVQRTEAPATSKRPNYLPFAGFALALGALSFLAYRRRRNMP